MFNYDQISNIIYDYLEEENLSLLVEFTGGCSVNQILLVEQSLGVTFSQSYKWFLKKYGSGGISGISILGI